MSFATNAAYGSFSSEAQKEHTVRNWLANKESICPYAPGLVKFVHLPVINSLSMKHVEYLAQELSAFYEAKEKGKRVGRWMLMPHEEWSSHEEAHHYAENIFWLLNAAYFYLENDNRSVQEALKKQLKGYPRGYRGEVLTPVIGHLPKQGAESVPEKSLFYSALSPLYNSKRFFRYCPHSVMPLIYASEFQELKEKHNNVSEQVCFEMAYSGLFEVFGEDLDVNLYALRQELSLWGAIVDRIAECLRASQKGVPFHSKRAKGSPESNLSFFRVSPTEFVNRLYRKHIDQLQVLTNIIKQTHASPKRIINASFAGSGLYTIPDYPTSEIITRRFWYVPEREVTPYGKQPDR